MATVAKHSSQCIASTVYTDVEEDQICVQVVFQLHGVADICQNLLVQMAEGKQ